MARPCSAFQAGVVLALVGCQLGLTLARHTHPTYTEKTFLQPFELGPGEIYNEFVAIEMPKGKIGIESFNADIVVCVGHGKLRGGGVCEK